MKRTLLPLQVGGVWLAVDASHAREILGRRPWAPVPDAGPYLPGITAWRGRGIAVVDLGAISGAARPPEPPGVRQRTVVLEVGACTLAVFAENVKEVLVVEETLLRPPHATRQRYASAELDMDGRPVAVLDLEAVVKAILPSAPEAP